MKVLNIGSISRRNDVSATISSRAPHGTRTAVKPDQRSSNEMELYLFVCRVHILALILTPNPDMMQKAGNRGQVMTKVHVFRDIKVHGANVELEGAPPSDR